MQSLANYRSMHMRMQQLAAEGALDGSEAEAAAQRDRAAAGRAQGQGQGKGPGKGQRQGLASADCHRIIPVL